MQETQNKLKAIISDYVDLPSEQINADLSLKCDVGLDSFGLMSMVNTIEDEFDVKIPDDKLMNFQTLNDIASYIDKQTI